MAIQMRRGLLADYDEDKMLAGEIAVTTDNDTENQQAFVAFAPGVSKRLLTEDDTLDVDDALSAYSENPVQNKVLKSELDAKAPLASPTFTGTPTAPTASTDTDNTQIATTEFVHDVATKTRVWYGSTSTSIGTAQKVVTVSDESFSLTAGTLLIVNFSSGNAVSGMSLNVNNLGARTVYGSGSLFRIRSQSKVLFRYGGTSWYIVERMPLKSVNTTGSSQLTYVSNRYYAVGYDSDGYLSVNVPWTDTQSILSATDEGDGVVSLALS